MVRRLQRILPPIFLTSTIWGLLVSLTSKETWVYRIAPLHTLYNKYSHIYDSPKNKNKKKKTKEKSTDVQMWVQRFINILLQIERMGAYETSWHKWKDPIRFIIAFG